MLCTGEGCPKAETCGKVFYRYKGIEPQTIEKLSSFGYGSISSTKIESNYICGPLGNFMLYERVKSSSINIICNECNFSFKITEDDKDKISFCPRCGNKNLNKKDEENE